MVNYSYTIKPGSLEDFLKNMPNRPEPTGKITVDYLKKLGYTSSNDFATISVLKFIGFLDSNGVITEAFKQFRDTQKGKAVMAQALRTAYSDLFSAYSNPCAENLENYFRTATGKAGKALHATEITFKTLCKFANFETSEPSIGSEQTGMQTPPQRSPPIIQMPTVVKENGVNVTVNIRFELPVTKEIDVYDRIFESLKKHLLSPSEKTN
jgi:hypothetical protein